MNQPSTLKEAMQRGYHLRAGESEKLFYRLLSEWSLWIPTDESLDFLSEYASVSLVDIKVHKVVRRDKRITLPCFTSESLGLEYESGEYPLVMSQGENVMTQLKEIGADFLDIDTGHTGGALIARREIASFLAGTLQQYNAQTLSVDGLDPKDIQRPSSPIDDAWATKLFTALSHIAEVNGAYVVDLRIGTVMDPRLIIEFKYDTDDASKAEILMQVKRMFGHVMDVYATNDYEISAVYRVVGRRLY